MGDDWAEDHHDVELMDPAGRVLVRARLPEGVEGIAGLHGLIGAQLGAEAGAERVVIGIETDQGRWVVALLAAGYRVCAVNPLQVARYRERYGVSGAKSDTGDAHTLADVVRTDSHQLRDYFPAALVAFADLAATDTLELLAKAPEPASAAALSTAQITAALRRARRRNIGEKATAIQAALRAPHLGQPTVVMAAYAAALRAQIAILTTLNEQITVLQGRVETHFGQHPDAEIIQSQPGLGMILGARVLAEFGDDPDRYASAKARKNYAATSPITRQSGKKKTVLARHVHNDRLLDALCAQAFAALTASRGARAYYDELRARGTGHRGALRQLTNRLVGILHGCLTTRTTYHEATAWSHHHVNKIAA